MECAVLTDPEIQELVHLALGASCGFTIHRVPEGGDNQVWFINEDLVLRINVDNDGQRHQSRELLVREIVRQYCNDPAIIPRTVASGLCRRHNVPFCIETRIHGLSLEELSANDITTIDLILLLKALKIIPLEVLRVANLEVEDDFDPIELKEDALQAFQRLSINNQFDDKAFPVSLDIPDHRILDTLDQPPVLLHADFKGEHILLNRDSRSVAGVLDWTDVQIGHPATDIAGLAISLGSARATEIGLQAGYSEAIVQRAIFKARCEAVILLDDRLNGDDESPVHLLRSQLKRALEQTSFE